MKIEVKFETDDFTGQKLVRVNLLVGNNNQLFTASEVYPNLLSLSLFERRNPDKLIADLIERCTNNCFKQLDMQAQHQNEIRRG